MRLLVTFGLLLLASASASAQDRRTACQAGTSSFQIQYGDYLECNFTSANHRYAFQAAAGDLIGFHVARLSGTGTPCVGIENSTGLSLLTRFCTNILTMPGDRDALQIQTAGTYYMVLSEGGGSIQPYGYSRILERVAPPTERAPLILPTQTIHELISPAADRDLYRFRVAPEIASRSGSPGWQVWAHRSCACWTVSEHCRQ